MIHLDTNYVIGLITSPSPLESQLVAWLRAGEEFAVSSIAWSEFLNGPVSRTQVSEAMNMVGGRILEFGEVEAAQSADFFNLTGRKRSKQIDCFIAASAMCSQSALATLNRRDFAPFVRLGLTLV